jgi:thioredoxin 1
VKEVPPMASSKVQFVNDMNFDATVLAASGKILVDFTATWCGPCKAQAAILDKVADHSDAVVVKVDVDECPELAARFAVRGMPTLLVFENGKETGRRLGLASEAAVLALMGQKPRAMPRDASVKPSAA